MSLQAPPFQDYFPSIEKMDAEQQQFYACWQLQWELGSPIPVDGQVSYIICFVYKYMANEPLDKLADTLIRLLDVYEHEKVNWPFFEWWLSDTYFLSGDYQKALEVFPRPPVGKQSTALTDNLLSLKLLCSERLAAEDVLTLFGPKVTKFGKQHLELVRQRIDISLRELERHEGVNLLEQWSQKARVYPYYAFTGSRYLKDTGAKCYNFSLLDEAEAFIKQITRDAENVCREEMNLPRVGEGWLAETELYYKIKEALSDYEVIHHARLPWLGQQHLDVFIPQLNVAIEYQGEQHFKPIDFFGGEQAFLQTQKRDAEKRKKCSAHGVKLIYVSNGYNLPALLHEIIPKDRIVVQKLFDW